MTISEAYKPKAVLKSPLLLQLKAAAGLLLLKAAAAQLGCC
jgi:hypothetical protein